MKIEIKKIMCPIDMSPESESALKYAIALARRYDSKLYIFHCLEQDLPFIDDVTHQHFLKQVESSIRLWGGAGNSFFTNYELLIVSGNPGKTINNVATDLDIDLIVMCSRRRPVAAAMLGSTTETVCRDAKCPILVTHYQEQEWVGATTCEIDLRKMLITVDYSKHTLHTLKWGITLAQEYQANLHLLHVLEMPATVGMSTFPPERISDSAKAYADLKNCIPKDIFLCSKVNFIVEFGHPATEIIKYAKEEDIDLICMGANGSSYLLRLLFGTNTDKVLRKSPCPVLVIREKGSKD